MQFRTFIVVAAVAQVGFSIPLSATRLNQRVFLEGGSAVARDLSNSTTVAARDDEFVHAEGLLDSLLGGLPIVGSLLGPILPIVDNLLKTVKTILPLDGLPIVGGLLGALEVNGTATDVPVNGTAPPAPYQTLDPVAEAARLSAAQSLLEAAAAELNKAVQVANVLAAAEESTWTASTTATSTATEPASATGVDFSFSGHFGEDKSH